MSSAQEKIERLTKMLTCTHDDACGGNDYILCNACGFMWDYRREPKADKHLLKFAANELVGISEAAERVQEGLRAERDQAIIDRDYNRVVSDEHRKTAMQCRKEMRDMLSRADAEAIAVKVFDAWRLQPSRERLGQREWIATESIREFHAALSRAFQGSAEPPTCRHGQMLTEACYMCGRTSARDLAKQPAPAAPSRHEIATNNPRLDGVCCVVSADGAFMCVKPRGHDGPHGDERFVQSAPERPTREISVMEAEIDARRRLQREVAALRAQLATLERDTLARARAAVEAEHLDDPTDSDGDRAYDLAVDHCLAALDALAASASDHREPQ